jgi:tRNA-specific 2-thiouridylase
MGFSKPSVSRAIGLLKKEGYEVIGLFMRNWDASVNNDILGNPTLNNNICPQEQDYNDALAVSNELGIPLHRIDFVKEYWDYVFTYFLDELKKGRTPNPDIMCNKYIKFDLFIKEAKRLGADYIATGHYARIKDGYLLRGIDDNKDQTYFLSQLTKEQLKNVLFPVGNIVKDEVRKIADELKLTTAKKKDSTGICFIGERNFKRFLENYLPNKEGDIINIETKQVLGKHIGLMYYTIGQRRGLDVGGTSDKLFVVGKDLNKNILYVCEGEDNEYLLSDSCIVEQVNFNCDLRPTECSAKFRYRQKDNPVSIEYLDNGELLVRYKNVKSVTPGQACVFYQDEKCLGGGIIKEVRKNNEKLWYLL